MYVFFWVIPWRLNFICRRFGTLCLFHLHRRIRMKESFIPICLWRWNSVPKRRHIRFRRRGITQKNAYNTQNTAKFWNQVVIRSFFKFCIALDWCCSWRPKMVATNAIKLCCFRMSTYIFYYWIPDLFTYIIHVTNRSSDKQTDVLTNINEVNIHDSYFKLSQFVSENCTHTTFRRPHSVSLPGKQPQA
jgi:hypothetical protein